MKIVLKDYDYSKIKKLMSPTCIPPVDIYVVDSLGNKILDLNYEFFDNKHDFNCYVREIKKKHSLFYIVFVYDTLNNEMRKLCDFWEWEVRKG